MRSSSIIISLSIIPLIPKSIELLHLSLNGSLKWSMIWSNEVVVWTLILSVFSFISISIAIKFRRYALTFFPLLSLIFSLVLFVQIGIEPSSKSDSPNLELLGFLSNQWSYW